MKGETEAFFKGYNFCCICGGKLERKGKSLLICKTCGQHHYFNPRPCNAAILTNSKGEILLVKRKFEPKKEYWDLPGGFIDLFETAEQSLVRELEEELGITLRDFSYLGSFYDTYRYQNITYPTLGFVYVGRLDTQKLESRADVSELKFFKPEMIPFAKIAFESIKQPIRQFLHLTDNIETI